MVGIWYGRVGYGWVGIVPIGLVIVPLGFEMVCRRLL